MRTSDGARGPAVGRDEGAQAAAADSWDTRWSTDRDRVVQALQEAVAGADDGTDALLGHLLRSSGKLVRPRLAMTTCYALDLDDEARDRAVRAGASVELLHLGTLYHDDVIDRAEERRGVVSCNSKFGNLRAVLGGDILLATSSVMAASLGRDEYRLMAETLDGLCRGQISESAHVVSGRRTLEDYFRAIGGKTAHLIRTAMVIGAYQSEINTADIGQLGEGAWKLGLAFQILDDVLDLVAPTEVTGKRQGQDLREGVITLPVLLAMERCPAVSHAVEALPAEDAVERCIDQSIACGAVREAVDDALTLGDQASSLISAVLGSNGEVQALVDAVLRRSAIESQLENLQS